MLFGMQWEELRMYPSEFPHYTTQGINYTDKFRIMYRNRLTSGIFAREEKRVIVSAFYVLKKDIKKSKLKYSDFVESAIIGRMMDV